MSPRKPSKPPHRHREKLDDRPNQGRPGNPNRNRDAGGPRTETKLPSAPQAGGPGGYWLFGHHAVEEAFRNPRRQIHRLVVAGDAPATPGRGIDAEIVERDFIDKLVGRDVVHQGIAARVSPLPEV